MKTCSKRKTDLAKLRQKEADARRYAKDPKARHAVTAKWRRENPEKAAVIERKREKKRNERIQSNPRCKLNKHLRSSIYVALKGNKAGRHWESLVGYTVDELKQHLEKLFKPGWTWDNYGSVWAIDHKIPKAVFNYEHPEDIDFRICWSLKNLQPMDKIENIKKSDKLSEPFQPSLLLTGVV